MAAKPQKKNYTLYKEGYKSKFINEILSQIDQGESFTLMGMPGIGKTYLFRAFDKNLDFWQELFPEKDISFFILYLDLTKLLDISPLGFYRLLLTKLYKTIKDNVQDIELQRETQKLYKESLESKDILYVFNTIEEIIKLIVEDKNFKICILIDDFSNLASFDKQFFNSLKALRNINSWKIVIGFSSDMDLENLLTPEVLDELYDLFLNRRMWLKPLDRKSALLLLGEFQRYRGFKLKKDIQKKITKLSSGHPGYMRALCRVYLDSKKDKKIFEDNDENIKKLALNSTVRARSEKFWTKMLDEYKEVLIEIIKKPNLPKSPKTEYLENIGIVKKNSDSLKLFSPLLEWYLREKYKEQLGNGADNKSLPKGLYIDPKSKTVYVDQSPLEEEPTSNEYKIIELLYKNKGKIVSREDLAHILWGKHAVEKYSDWAIDRTVSRIRKKLGDDAHDPRFVQTVKGRGLRMVG